MIEKSLAGALVIGGDHPGLGVARSLGRRGIPVVVLDDQHSVSSFSRYVKRVVRVKDLRDARKTIDAILEVGQQLGLKNWVLFPTRDETVAAISQHREELCGLFRVTTPDWRTVQWACNKKNTYEMAVQLGIPCPHTFNPLTVQELGVLESRLPLAIKPAVKENFFYATGAKAWRADNGEQLRFLFGEAGRQIVPEEILVQEIIPGDGSCQFSYCAFFKDGQARGSLVAKRIRQHPREFGRAATYVETVQMPVVEELGLRFLKAIDYYGLVEVEFKYDARDGRYKLLDVNARTWGFQSLGAAAGVDFPYMMFADQLGETLPCCRSEAGVGWLRMLTDLPTALAGLAMGHLSPGDYLDSLRRARIESVFCKSDPLPSLGELLLLPYLLGKKMPWHRGKGD
jgi:predicted ATP-grasp superfamily ATP-dependent carboligase